MDWEETAKAHATLRHKFRHAARSGQPLDRRQVEDETGCEIGRWLAGAGKQQHGELPSFTTCLERHAEFHRQAGIVAGKVNARTEDIDTLMAVGSDYSKASAGMMDALRDLHRDVEGDRHG